MEGDARVVVSQLNSGLDGFNVIFCYFYFWWRLLWALELNSYTSFFDWRDRVSEFWLHQLLLLELLIVLLHHSCQSVVPRELSEVSRKVVSGFTQLTEVWIVLLFWKVKVPKMFHSLFFFQVLRSMKSVLFEQSHLMCSFQSSSLLDYELTSLGRGEHNVTFFLRVTERCRVWIRETKCWFFLLTLNVLLQSFQESIILFGHFRFWILERALFVVELKEVVCLFELVYCCWWNVASSCCCV